MSIKITLRGLMMFLKNKSVPCASCNIIGSRGMKQWEFGYRGELYRRRLIAGPIETEPRSKIPNWNYETELYCFANRLSEKFDGDLLRQAFMHKSYTDSVELENKSALSLNDGGESTFPLTAPNLQNYDPLLQIGEEFTRQYLEQILSKIFPDLPQDGVEAIRNYLLSTETLHRVASNLGIYELIFIQESPIPDGVVAEVLLAIIGSLKKSQGKDRATLFVRDFILSQLIGQDLDEIYGIKNPLSTLFKILTQQGLSEPESRLISQSGQESVLACYHVGIYSGKRLLGQAPGETVSIAEEMAAHDALMTLYGIRDNHKPLDFSDCSKTGLKSKHLESNVY